MPKMRRSTATGWERRIFRTGVAWVLGLFALASGAFAANVLAETSAVSGLTAFLSEHIAAPARDLLFGIILTKQFAFFFALTGLLAVVLPATRKERFFSKSLLQDFIWFVYQHMFLWIMLGTYVTWLKAGVDNHFPHLASDALQAWPWWAKLVFGLLLVDLLDWAQHLLMHKVPILWKFHKLHHSQREINFFTNYRTHFVDDLTFNLVSVLPFVFLSFEIPQIWIILVIRKWHPILIHANIRTNLGPLKYFMVTPQSHRVHHSLQPEHFDKNYGCVFAIWDQMFGTQVRDYEVYPDTGIHEEFPVEQDYKWWQVPFLPILQSLYPFKEIGQELVGAKPTTADQQQ